MERYAPLEKDTLPKKVIAGKINKVIIILGSSRGSHDFIAGQIQDSLKLSAFNLSYPKSDIGIPEFILQSLL